MTMTETRPEVDSPMANHDTGLARQPLQGLSDWITTADHTKVGRAYVVWSLLFGLASVALAAVVGFERIDPNALAIFTRLTDAAQVNSLATWGIMYCGVLPLLMGLAVAVVPLQVGARTIAFPRACALGFWMWLIGSAVFVGSYVANGGPGGGEAHAVELTLLSLGMLCVGLMITAACVATTVLTLRAPRLRLDRAPFFAYASMMQSIMVLLVLPVLIGNLIFLYIDHRYGRISFGGNRGIAPWLQWAIRQPTTGLVVVPALGIVADIVAVFARNRQKMAGVIRAAITLAAVLSFGAFAQDRVWSKVTTQFTFIVVSLAAVVGPLIVLALCGLTMKEGKPRFGAPLVFALVGGLIALDAGAAAALLPFKGLHLLGTQYEQAQFELAFGAGLVAGIGGLVYWAPRLWRKSLPDKPAAGLGVLGLLGIALVAVPNIIAGFIDQPRGLVTFAKEDGTAVLNTLSAVGYVVLAVTILALLASMMAGFLGKKSSAASADPWESHTLEWASGAIDIRSDRPLLDAREAL